MTLIQIIIALAAIQSEVDPRLLSAVCWVESNHQPYVTSFNDGNGRNSHGLCQVQTRTARHMGFKGPVSDLYSVDVNAFYAGKYLKYQLKRYKGDIYAAIAAYNMGTARKKCIQKKCKFLNQNYVDKVLKAMENNK